MAYAFIFLSDFIFGRSWLISSVSLFKLYEVHSVILCVKFNSLSKVEEQSEIVTSARLKSENISVTMIQADRNYKGNFFICSRNI